jgi:hypothetical protein
VDLGEARVFREADQVLVAEVHHRIVGVGGLRPPFVPPDLRHEIADRTSVEPPLLVGRRREVVVDRLEDRDTTAGPQHAVELAERSRLVLDVDQRDEPRSRGGGGTRARGGAQDALRGGTRPARRCDARPLSRLRPGRRYSSLRWSELVALRAHRCDLVRDVVRVEEKITESGHLIPGEPKTERSRRAVTLPHSITLELTEHMRRYPPSEDGLVFTAPKGGPIRRPAFYRLVWKSALERTELEGFRFGQLRHTGATLALEAGANPVLVAFRLGHTSTRMLEQHYAGRLDRADRDLARALDAAAQMRHAGGTGSTRADAQLS